MCGFCVCTLCMKISVFYLITAVAHIIITTIGYDKKIGLGSVVIRGDIFSEGGIFRTTSAD